MRRRDRSRRKLVRKTPGRLFATSFAFVALFFAGASVSAWGGSEVGGLVGSTEETGEVSTAETTTEQETVPSDPPGPANELSRPTRRLVRARVRAVGAARPPSVPVGRDLQHRQTPGSSRQMEPAEPPTPQPPSKSPPRHRSAAIDPEARAPGSAATIWLHRQLPDPTPPAKRLALDFAVQLAFEAKRAQVSWSLVLAVLRGQGHTGPVPASSSELRDLSRRLAELRAESSPTDGVRELTGSASFAEKAIALSQYNRAVGLYSLVTGLERAQPRLTRLMLDDPRIDIYAGGRGDLASGLIDVRVIVLIRYLTNVFGQASVSSLHSGHRLYARPGIVSAHIYGLAVDIAALGKTPIAGHQQPGGITEQAVQSILLLPAELQPQQVISLLGLGGPSFPLADHADHIHVGY